MAVAVEARRSPGTVTPPARGLHWRDRLRLVDRDSAKVVQLRVLELESFTEQILDPTTWIDSPTLKANSTLAVALSR